MADPLPPDVPDPPVIVDVLHVVVLIYLILTMIIQKKIQKWRTVDGVADLQCRVLKEVGPGLVLDRGADLDQGDPKVEVAVVHRVEVEVVVVEVAIIVTMIHGTTMHRNPRNPNPMISLRLVDPEEVHPVDVVVGRDPDEAVAKEGDARTMMILCLDQIQIVDQVQEVLRDNVVVDHVVENGKPTKKIHVPDPDQEVLLGGVAVDAVIRIKTAEIGIEIEIKIGTEIGTETGTEIGTEMTKTERGIEIEIEM